MTLNFRLCNLVMPFTTILTSEIENPECLGTSFAFVLFSHFFLIFIDMSAGMKIDINETFELAYRFVTETNEHIFLTGKAGTGKTTFLKYLKEHCNKNIVVAAPTGVAAINAGGVTLHSLFQLPFQPFLPNVVSRAELRSKLKYSRSRLDTIEKMDLLVIDEISMVRCDVIDAIDEILRSVRKRPQTLFGGVQVLFIGDLYQLPPVAKRDEWEMLSEYYASAFFFDAQCLRQEMPVFIELSTIYRQSDDTFIHLLNRIRNNSMNEATFEMLNERFQPDFRPESEGNFITLTSHNAQADTINQRELSKLFGESFSYKAEVEGDFPENNFPADADIILKKGTQVMFIKNDVFGNYFNGKIGVVHSLDDDEIIVNAGGELINVNLEHWENTRYELDRKEGKLKQETLGTFTQYPLRLAWATTIHKSQGLTFNNVMIDAAKAFAGGQVYVALSRCTSLEGIVLLSKIPPQAITCNPHVVAIQSRFSGNVLAERFQGARAAFLQKLLSDIFLFDEITKECDHLKQLTTQHQSKLNAGAGDWTTSFCEKAGQEAETGRKFMMQVNRLLAEENVIEKNPHLQKRIAAAAVHFDKQVFELLQLVEHPGLESENMDIAKAFNVVLKSIDDLMRDVYDSLQYCMGDFVLHDFLKHKFDYKPQLRKINIYASAGEENEVAENGDLLNKLRHWRNEVCRKFDLPVYLVANQESLKMIVKHLPATESDLGNIKGFGPAKVKKYGSEILDIIQEYCEKNGLERSLNFMPAKPKKEKKKTNIQKESTQTISYNLFKEGKSIEEIAQERKMAITTIEGHLSTFIVDGLVNIDQLVSAEFQKQINDAGEKFGWDSLKTLKENLPEQISYGQIRMTKASLKA